MFYSIFYTKIFYNNEHKFMLLFATKAGKKMIALYLENIKVLMIWVET
jgi:hypothetical protein